jgi:DNA-binding transcriptional ArsR family regulator
MLRLMADLDEFFALTTLDQVHTMADPLRVRILDRLVRKPMTVKMLGTDLQEPPAKVHYHVRELERIGVIRLVETREKGGVLEKYYRAVARNFTVVKDLLSKSHPDELSAIVDEYVQLVQRGLSAALAHYQEHPDPSQHFTISNETVWATPEEFQALVEQLSALLQSYEAPRNQENEREWTINVIGHLTASERLASPAPSTSPIRRAYHFGATALGREDLDKLVAEGSRLDLTVVGVCTFARDVPPDLVERAFARVRVYGVLHASLEVRAVLQQKGGEYRPNPEEEAG